MGCRAKEGNRQLKPESFIIGQDENGQKYATLSFNECRKKNTKMPVRETKKAYVDLFEQSGNHLCPVTSLEKCLSLLPANPPAFLFHLKQTNYTKDVW